MNKKNIVDEAMKAIQEPLKVSPEELVDALEIIQENRRRRLIVAVVNKLSDILFKALSKGKVNGLKQK